MCLSTVLHPKIYRAFAGGGPGAAEAGEGTWGSSKAAEGSPRDSQPSSWLCPAGGAGALRAHNDLGTAWAWGVGAVGGVSQPFFHGNH